LNIFAMQKNATLLIMTLAISAPLCAAEYERMGRYYDVKISMTTAQMDPLQQLVVIEFPETVNSLANAYEFLLMPTGYSLASEQNLDLNFVRLMNKALPISQRRIKGTVSEILQVLAGSNYVVVRDPLERTISLDAIY